MNRDKLVEDLRKLAEPKVESFAASQLAAARETPRAAIEISRSTDEETSGKADLLLQHLEDLAIVPMIEAPVPSDARGRIALIKQAVNAELALRRKVITRLDKLLDDTNPVPVRTGGRSEQRPPPRRVCDEAYLLMRQIVHLGEPPVEADVQANIFLNSPDDFKDEQIRKARQSGIWNRAITGKDIDDYDDRHPDPGTRPTPRK